jgi:hypothetical protein
MSGPLELLGQDPRSGRRYLLLDGRVPSAWEVPSGLGLFTLLLAIDAQRYEDEQLNALGTRLLDAGLVYLCASGPESERVHTLFDLAFIADEAAGVQRPFLMTTDHDGEALAEALWFSIDLAAQEDVRNVAESPVLIGTDDDEWCQEIRHRLSDVDELRRHVTDDLRS